MAFGVVWLGLAAAHLGMAICPGGRDVLATRYWRPSLVSTHDSLVCASGKEALFNVDICGGLPALIVEMLVAILDRQDSVLPARPVEWKSGASRVLPVGARSLSNGEVGTGQRDGDLRSPKKGRSDCVPARQGAAYRWNLVKAAIWTTGERSVEFGAWIRDARGPHRL